MLGGGGVTNKLLSAVKNAIPTILAIELSDSIRPTYLKQLYQKQNT